MRRLYLSWACALAFGPALRAQTHGELRDTPEVRKLVIDGAKHVDVHDLKKSISTQASECRSLVLEVICLFSNSPTFEDKHYLDEEELRRDVLRIRLYYWKRGYRDTEVDTAVTPTGSNKVKVVFTVTEGPPTLIRQIDIPNDTTLISPKTRRRISLLHVNDPLDLIQLDSMRLLFQNELWDQGYGDGVVDTSVTVNEAAHLADVTLTMTRNRRTTVGSISISGNEKITDRTIRNSLTFGPGDLWRQSDMLESQRNLYESNLFRLAAIGVPPQRDSAKHIDIDVTEAPLHEARMGPGLNNVDFLQFQAHYTDYNFFGGARRLDTDATIGNLLAPALSGRGPFRNVAQDVPDDSSTSPYLQPTYNASIDFKKPAFLRPSDAVGVGAFAHRSLNPGVFVDRGFGGQVTFTHQLRPRAPASVNYRYELNRVEASDTYFCVNYGVCDTLTISSLRSRESLSPATLTGFIDRSDEPFSPTKGYVARLDFEHASAMTLSDFRYNRLFFDGAAYGHRSGSKSVYSAHLRFGVVRAISSGPESGVLHPRKRFYAGGANSVRGYPENQLGPRILTIDDSTLLRGAASVGGICGLTIDDVKFCDPNTSQLSSRDFLTQPLGGTSLLEGSVEYRVPLPLGENFRHFFGAMFIDGGIVGSGDIKGLQSLSGIIRGQSAVTPGVGLRYQSGFGPIRLDFAFNPTSSQTLGVVTSVRDRNGVLVLAPLTIPRRYSPGTSFFDRITIHFSIGEAF